MASYLQIEGISKSYGAKVLFHDIAFNVNEGDKIALVAPNGTGKTSLMRILSGKEKSDSGGRIRFLKDIRIAFLEQEYAFDPGKSVFDQLCEAVADESPEAHQDRILRIKKLLGSFRLGDPGRKMQELSGGEVKRVALTDLLSRDADFLLMDEPTNHLDIEAVEFLEKTLGESRRTLLMVTHDRYFLDRVCNQVMELDGGQAFVYKGDYENFLEKRQQRIAQYNAETDRVRNILRRELEWIRSTPCARSGKAQYRIDAFYRLKERAEAVRTDTRMSLEGLGASKRLGTKIIDCKDVCYSLGGRTLLKDFSYCFQRGEKIGIVGPNGIGKSTLLRLLTGELAPQEGVIERGESLEIAWYRQEGIAFAPGETVLDLVPDGFLLDRFLFPHEMRLTPVERLSGGEKRRLYLLTVLRRQPNLLILDEPTNDLDIVTLNILEEYLSEYKGTLLMVSHDRHFLDRLADHLLVFTGEGAVKDFVGHFSEYRAYVRALEEEKRRTAKAVAAQGPRDTAAGNAGGAAPGNGYRGRHEEKGGLSYKEKRELEQVEAEIAALEAEKKELEASLSSGTLDYPALEKASQRHREVSALLEAKENRWLELSERL